MDLAKAIENKVVGFQGYLDDTNVPITVQGKILEIELLNGGNNAKSHASNACCYLIQCPQIKL